MILNQILKNKKLIIAICDDDILNKTFQENETILDLTSDFYNGKKIDPNLEEEKINKLLKMAYLINGVGENTINLLIKLNYIISTDIKTIENVPYIQILVGNETS